MGTGDASVAGVQTPAFVERPARPLFDVRPIADVSPEFRLRPSLSDDACAQQGHRHQRCRRSSDSGLR